MKNKFKFKLNGFTLAEVLITLGIIGVVAALTIPTLVKSYQQQVVISAVQKFYSTMAQAIKASEIDNGQIGTWDFPVVDGNGAPGSATVTFLNTYILPYLKISKKCDLDTSTSCWNAVLKPNGTSSTLMTNTDANIAKYTLQDGSEVAFKGFNNNVSIATLVDINGAKAPNTLGNDVFAFVIAKQYGQPLNTGLGDIAHINTGGFYTMGVNMDITVDSYTWCGCSKSVTMPYAGFFCSAKIMTDGWQIKSDYPFFN